MEYIATAGAELLFFPALLFAPADNRFDLLLSLASLSPPKSCSTTVSDFSIVAESPVHTFSRSPTRPCGQILLLLAPPKPW